MFSEFVQQNLNYYVYRLIDPRNQSTFYIGKGRGNRIFDHVNSVKNNNRSVSNKELIIQSLLDQNLQPGYVIHRHGMDEQTAFEVEGALLDAYPEALNDANGHDNASRGLMTVKEILFKYELPELPLPNFSVLIINVNNISNPFDRDAIYKQVQGDWVLSVQNASRMEYVLAVYKGIAIGIFKPLEWLPSKQPRRFYFKGKEASSEIWQMYIGENGKRITNPKMKNSQNPIKYYHP